MYLVSKCGIKFKCDFTPNNLVKHYDLSADSIITSVNNSLANLGCDYLDLLLVHRPSPLMNVDEIAETFYQLQREGKVKQFGVSNFTPSQFDLLNSRIPLLTNQIEFSVLANQALFDGSLDQLQQYKLRPMAWSPLAGGKIFNSDKPQLTQLLQELADKYAVSVEQIALAWILRHPSNIQIVLGTQKSSRLINTLAAQHIELDIQDWFAILETVNGYPVA
jgi:predicted oxidoreductase